MIFAFINNNQVERLEEATEEFVSSNAHLYQQIIRVDEMPRMPKLGWLFENGALVTNLPDVTPRQMRQALILSGVSMDMIDTALNALPEPAKSLAHAEWEYSISFKRNRPLVNSVGAMLGWTQDQLDSLWTFAGTL